MGNADPIRIMRVEESQWGALLGVCAKTSNTPGSRITVRLNRQRAPQRDPSHGRGSLHTESFVACAPHLPVTVIEIVAYPTDRRP